MTDYTFFIDETINRLAIHPSFDDLIREYNETLKRRTRMTVDEYFKSIKKESMWWKKVL